ncbi:MAG: hypothetical protein K6T81_05405 [Alicyclobacillus macrosporangiidus]|uniref:ornithine cyclodeaminase family protein n=1 Tax=Alicyclobacillus macrosporangiidus TaxID=392015 RepID=UPI0026EC3914|nr:hypothetical protein [Alicyclobacillus macrosporangiidus]MCL6598160.1 hypothetical protein [Alicyclobacillus macrosporangiidus]
MWTPFGPSDVPPHNPNCLERVAQVLVLSQEEIESLVSVADCLTVLEQAYLALARGDALNMPRMDSLMELDARRGTVYSFKTMGGVIQHGVQALRINSDVIHWPEMNGARRRVKIPSAAGRWVGLIYLFDPCTGTPLAIMPDGVIQHWRVGATSGLAAKFLAPPDAETVALLGTGWQAQTQLQAIVEVVRPRRVQVFSPTAQHREAFCRHMERLVPADLIPVTSPDAAVSGAQIVMAATNAMAPVLQPAWIRPGMHFSTVKVQEVSEAFLAKSKVYLHTKRQAKADVVYAGNVPLYELEQGWWKKPEVRQYPDLEDLVAGRTVGRAREHDVTLFVNNVGMGLQFAAVGALVLERARQRGMGRELPDEWFTESVHP